MRAYSGGGWLAKVMLIITITITITTTITIIITITITIATSTERLTLPAHVLRSLDLEANAERKVRGFTLCDGELLGDLHSWAMSGHQ
jgi:hypothetical protein